jgi:hypothetical protein
MGNGEKILDGLFDALYEMTGWFWQIGVAVALLLLFFAYLSYGWVGNYMARLHETTLLAGVVEKYGYFMYMLPILLVIFASIFAVKTFKTYQKYK